MSMLLLLPIGLAALTALLLPLLVHLARRNEQRVVPFAALRWLRALPQPRRKHRFEELLLLLLRLLLLAALALLLAQPVLFGRPDRRPWVALAPGVDAQQARAAVRADDARWHRLASGFPAIGAADAKAKSRTVDTASFASLLRQLDAELPAGTPLTVVVPAVIDGADAQRPTLTRRVDWRVLPAAPAMPGSDTATAGKPGAFALQVRHAPDRAASLRYLQAAGEAWASAATPAGNASPSAPATSVVVAAATRALDPGTRQLAWLVPGPVPQAVQDWMAAGGQAVLDADARMPAFAVDAPVVWGDAEGPLARAVRVGRGRAIRLERPLLPAPMPVLLEPDFPDQLRSLFAAAPLEPQRVAAADYAPRSGAAAYPERPRPLAPSLVWAVAVLLLLERWFASGPRRSERP